MSGARPLVYPLIDQLLEHNPAFVRSFEHPLKERSVSVKEAARRL
jgi:hypothetical protein